MRSGSTVSSFWPTSDDTLWVETTLPVTFARNIASLLHRRKRLPRDDDLFVRRHRPDRCSAAVLGNDRFALRGCVFRLVELDAELLQAVADGRTHRRGVFSNAAGEND